MRRMCGKRSRERETGLTYEQRIEHSITRKKELKRKNRIKQERLAKFLLKKLADERRRKAEEVI